MFLGVRLHVWARDFSSYSFCKAESKPFVSVFTPASGLTIADSRTLNIWVLFQFHFIKILLMLIVQIFSTSTTILTVIITISILHLTNNLLRCLNSSYICLVSWTWIFLVLYSSVFFHTNTYRIFSLLSDVV